MQHSVDSLLRERDLYLRMLEIGESDDVDRFLHDALDLAMDATGARRAYLALHYGPEGDGGVPRYRLHRGFEADDMASVEHRVSQGIIAASRRENRVLNIVSAVLSQEWGSQESVVRNDVSAVLCAPIGAGRTGALYLEGEAEGARVFAPRDEAMVVLLARHLGPIAERVLMTMRASSQDPTLRFRSGGRFASFCGRSQALASVLERATTYAAGQAPILITGDTGTGKTELAREIHAISPRSSGPFVVFDLAVQAPTLLEGHLFGAEAGAYTDRRTPLKGAVAEAKGGTLFLDEIGDLPLTLQARLLRLLEEGRYTPLGSSREIQADVRVIAATHRDPKEEAAAGRFRRDLFYRLDTFPIHVPAIDDRLEDVPVLIEALGQRLAQRAGVSWPGITPGARMAAEARSWAGNVREIRNCVERALLSHHGDRPIDGNLLFDKLATSDDASGDAPSWDHANRSFQREFLNRALEAHGGAHRATYEAIQLSKSRYFELVRELGVRGGAEGKA